MKKVLKLFWRAIAAAWCALTFIRQLTVNLLFLLAVGVVAYIFWGSRGAVQSESAVLALNLAGSAAIVTAGAWRARA